MRFEPTSWLNPYIDQVMRFNSFSFIYAIIEIYFKKYAASAPLDCVGAVDCADSGRRCGQRLLGPRGPQLMAVWTFLYVYMLWTESTEIKKKIIMHVIMDLQ